MHIPTKEERKAKAEEAKRKRAEKKALAKANRLEKKKNPRIKTGVLRYVLRGIVIFLILVFVALGVYFATHVENATSVKRKMTAYRAEINELAGEQQRVEAFANSFVVAYYSIDLEDETDSRQQNLLKYLGEQGIEETDFPYSTEVTSANVVSANKIGNGYEVKVRVTLNVFVPIEDAEVDSYSIVNEVYTVQVPISLDGKGNMTARAVPTHVVDTNSPNSEELDLAGEEADTTDENEVSALARNFLKAYCGNSKSALEYLVTENFDLATLNSVAKYKDVNDVTVSWKGDYLMAKVSYTVEGTLGEETQTIVLNIVKKDRYYVDSISSVWW